MNKGISWIRIRFLTNHFGLDPDLFDINLQLGQVLKEDL